MYLPGPALTVALLCALSGVTTLDVDPAEFEQFHVVYEWYKLDYTWPDDGTKARALSSQQFIPENNALSGVKVHGDRIYLTVPRYKQGVPATLVSIAVNSPDKNASPKLEPFPSWSMQQLGNCSALQFVQNIEVDTEGRMWILDTGRVNIMQDSVSKCPAKLVIVDLKSAPADYNAYRGSTTSRYPTTYGGEFDPTSSFAGTNNFNNQGVDNQGVAYNNLHLGSRYDADNERQVKVIRSFQFPENLVSLKGGYLADIVLDPANGWYAYISDAGDADPGIIVYSFLENRAWKVRDDRTMKGDPSLRKFSVNGRPVEVLQNVSPLALDVKRRQLYYSPLSSMNLYAISTLALRDSMKMNEASKSVRDLGKKLGLSEGFAMDANGVFYYGLIDDNGVAKWETNATSFQDGQHVISKDVERLQWPTNFGFDDAGYLWLVSNRMQNYITGRVNLNEPNYRVIRGLTGSKSYLYTEGVGKDDDWGISMMTSTMETVMKSTSFGDDSRISAANSQNELKNASGRCATSVAAWLALVCALFLITSSA